MIREVLDKVDDWMDDSNDLLAMAKGVLVFGGGVSLIAFMIVYPFFWYEGRQPSFTIKKSDFTCSQAHYETQLVLVGKVWLPREVEVCDEYKRIR